VWTLANSANAIRDISLACKSPFLTGNPDTTKYASPIVSLRKQEIIIITHYCNIQQRDKKIERKMQAFDIRVLQKIQNHQKSYTFFIIL
jgi:hypothetical protein